MPTRDTDEKHLAFCVNCPSLRTDWSQTITAWLLMLWDRKVKSFSDPAATHVILTRNFFGLKCKEPLVANRFRPNLRALGLKENTTMCDVSVLPSHRQQIFGQKTLEASRIKWPSWLSEYDQTCAACGLCAGSATCDVSVSPLQVDPW
jgi:hypothetical protein